MKLQRVLAASLVVAAGALSGTALAQGYVGASIGQSDYKVDCTGLTTCDTKDTGYKLFGGYMFTRNLGVEAGWVDLGKVKATADLMIAPPVEDVASIVVSGAGELKASGPFLAGIAVAPIGSGSVFGKVGLANLKSELSVTAGGVTDSTSTRHTDVFYGVGAGYNFTKNLAVRAEWERFRIKYSDGVEEFKDNVDLLSVGVVYRF
jgi:OOP family OmpA-OmpF porin